MILLDRLRLPAPFDPTAPAYKDWLHVNVVDHRSGIVGLVNCSLHGSPGDPQARAVGAALVDVPGLGWAGNLMVTALDEARLRPAGIATPGVALNVDHANGRADASAVLSDDALTLRLHADATGPAVTVEQPLPLGSGWVSWYVLPRLEIGDGQMSVGGQVVNLAGASAYHDHNWGRWHWGDDVGWDWGSFLTPAPGPVIVVARTADRLRRRPGPAIVVVDQGGRRRTFRGASVSLSFTDRFRDRLRRIPGAMAALRADRAAPVLPGRVTVLVDDGRDRLRLDFRVRAAAQLVVADPVTGGHSFVHELSGVFTWEGRLGGRDVAADGLGVFEVVD